MYYVKNTKMFNNLEPRKWSLYFYDLYVYCNYNLT
jgi:hypothetical protein